MEPKSNEGTDDPGEQPGRVDQARNHRASGRAHLRRSHHAAPAVQSVTITASAGPTTAPLKSAIRRRFSYAHQDRPHCGRGDDEKQQTRAGITAEDRLKRNRR